MKKLPLLIILSILSFALNGQVIANFTTTDSIGCGSNHQVNFLDESTPVGEIISWVWDFGDGSTSNQQHPTHTFIDAGTYSICLTVTNSSGQDDMLCKTDFIVLNSAPVCIIDANVPTINCYNPTVILDGSQSSVGPNFNYLWSTTNGNILSGSNTPNVVIDNPGLYTLVVTNIVTGCSSSTSIEVMGDINQPIAVANVSQVLSCTNQSITLDGTGSSAGTVISYLWTTQDGIILFNSEASLNPLVGSAGTYILTVTDEQNGCTSSNSVSVSADVDFPHVNIQSPTVLSCNNPTVTLDGTGSSASPDFTYEWKKGNFVISTNISTTVSSAGIYSLEVTNANMSWCSVEKEIVIENDGSGPNINLPVTDLNDTIYNCQEVIYYSADLMDASCVNCTVEIRDANDTLICDALPCVYDLVDFINTGYFPVYPFSINVTENNCTSSFILPNPTSQGLTTFQTITYESCNGISDGSIDLSVSGTASPYVFDWDDIAGTNDPLDRSGLTAGIYTLHITDAVGCDVSAPDGFTYEVKSYPIAKIDIIGPLTISCVEPSIVLNAETSQVNPGNDIEYLWKLNGTTVSTVYEDEFFLAGNYQLIITDVGTGCTATDVIEITEDTTPPIADAGPDQVLNCSVNGSVTLDGTGSNTSTGDPLTYEWSFNGIVISTTINPVVSQPGIYTLTIVDINNGCTASDDVLVTVAPPNIALETTSVVCPGGVSTLSFSVTYVNCQVEVVDAMGNVVCNQPCTGFLCSVNPTDGPFQITLTDFSTGCQNSENFSIAISNPIVISQTVITDISCFGENDGAIDIEVAGGSAAYSYSWSNNSITEDQSGLTPGIYFVTIVDTNSGCELIESFEINEPDELTITNTMITNVSCTGSNDGSIEISVAGGTGNYTYLWSDGSNSNIVTDLSPMIQMVTITDSNGCFLASPEYTVIQNSCFDFSNDTTICVGGIASLSNEVSIAGWNYAWSPTANINDPTIPNPIVSPTETTTYFLTITDGNGMVIFNAQGPTVSVQNYLDFGLLDFSNSPLCDGDTLELYGNMGTTFVWTGPNGYVSTSMNPTINTVTELESGNYSLTITDDFGCTASADVEVFIDDDCVWPGDTDTNMVVNHFDLLNIGLAYDSVGTTRENPSFDWFGQPSFDWSQTTPTSNVNYKHIDTDGNGIIEAADTVAITQNFGFTHNFSDPDILNQFTDLPPSDGLTVVTPFYIEPDTLIEGETIALDIILGDVSNVVTGLYGIGFSIEYDSSVVVPGSASINFDDCWLGDVNADAISIQFDFPNPGRIDAAITRIDGMEMDGYGLFGDFIITLEDDILLWGGNGSNNFGGTTTDVTADFTITNYHLINFSQEEIIVQGTTTTAPIEETTSLSFIELNELISVFPNPAKDVFFIASQKIDIERVRIFSATGELKTVKTKTENNLEISTKELASGIYFIEIQTREGIVTKKISIVK